ncbi:helix-turn-helix transcriptional regulator [Salibacterium aidingense]|uniref:helix-turn-helix transcriptional regulator n=1 Tax=Salibacterium aidingense TaxID=384933 RepID=UPI000413E98D|nr:helix-turn-helix transcriptional regulator [Salibacterium aidingense]
MRDLTRTDDIIQEIPETESFFYGISAAYGNTIFSYRMDRDLTQKQLATMAGVGVKTIHRAEGGSSNLGVQTYEKIFRALGVPKEDIPQLYRETAANKPSLKS